MSQTDQSSLSVLRHRAFRLFWTGNLISGCGVWVQNLALGWLIAKLPNSSMLLGVYGFASLAPILVLAVFGGTLADRFNRRAILIVTQTMLMALALLLSGLTYFGVIQWWQMIATAALTGVALAMNSPAYQAIIPDLVPPQDLTRAIALNSVQFNLARIVGHSLAGLIVAQIGEAGCFLLNGLSYLAMLYALWRIPVASGHRRKDPAPFLVRTREGLAYVLDHRETLRLILIVGCISLFGLPYFFMLPSFGRDVLHINADQLGWLTATVSAGGLAGGLLMTRITRRWDKRIVVAVCALFCWAALLGFALSRHYVVSCFLLTLVGFTLVLTLATVNNLLQASTPPDMRGRVMSIHGLAVNGFVPLGSLAVGLLAEWFSTPLAVAAMAALGTAATAGVLATALRSRELRNCAVEAPAGS